MTDRLQKKDVVQHLARRMGTDEQTAEAWNDAFTKTLYEAFKEGRSMTLPGFSSFYVRPHHEACAFKFNPGQKLRALFGWSSS
jgi:DNA-binding protein HU-beta